jgi:hypothetical protein
MQFVHDEDQELLRRGGRAFDKSRIDQQSRLRPALYGCGLDPVSLDDVQKAQESGQGVAAAREAIENPMGDR